MDYNCHIPDLVYAFSYLELAKPLSCMTVASNFIILTTMWEQNKQTQQVKISKTGTQQSTLCHNLTTVKKLIYNREALKGTQTKHISQNEIQDHSKTMKGCISIQPRHMYQRNTNRLIDKNTSQQKSKTRIQKLSQNNDEMYKYRATLYALKSD